MIRASREIGKITVRYLHLSLCLLLYLNIYLPPSLRLSTHSSIHQLSIYQPTFLYFLSSVYHFKIRFKDEPYFAKRICKTVAIALYFLWFSFVVGVFCHQKNEQYLVNFSIAEFYSWILGGQSIREYYFMVSFSCNPSRTLFCGK